MKYKVDFELELRKNPHNGIYIAIEGIDGSGKTTQVEELSSYFKKQGKNVVLTREPRKEGLIGDMVHKILRGEIKMTPKALQYLFTTDRMLHHEELIEPSLKSGKIVISDRCFWSAVVYGILDKAEDYDFKHADQILVAQSILSMYHQFIVPDYTFLLRISLDTAMRRIEEKHKHDLPEMYEKKEKIKRVLDGYDWLSKNFKNEITVIDGEVEINEVTNQLVENLNKK